MPVAKKPEVDTDKLREEGLQTISAFKVKVVGMKITSELQYMQADTMLSQVQADKKMWIGKLDPIIKPQYEALEGMYSLRRELVNPREECEKLIKGAMAEWDREKLRIEREAQAKRDEEARKIAEEERKAQEALVKAKTPQMQAKLQEIKADLAEKRQQLSSYVPPAPTKAAGSSSRPVKKWRLISIEDFILSFMANDAPEVDASMTDNLSLLTIDSIQMNAKFIYDQKVGKPVPLGIGIWLPGIEVYEDVTITGKPR